MLMKIFKTKSFFKFSKLMCFGILESHRVGERPYGSTHLLAQINSHLKIFHM